jgi:hypothetical protein
LTPEQPNWPEGFFESIRLSNPNLGRETPFYREKFLFAREATEYCDPDFRRDLQQDAVEDSP